MDERSFRFSDLCPPGSTIPRPTRLSRATFSRERKRVKDRPRPSTLSCEPLAPICGVSSPKEKQMALFSEKSVLVLGGSRGIGASIVRRFGAEGGNVAFTYAGSREAAEALAGETGAEAIHADSADPAAVAALVKARKRPRHPGDQRRRLRGRRPADDRPGRRRAADRHQHPCAVLRRRRRRARHGRGWPHHHHRLDQRRTHATGRRHGLHHVEGGDAGSRAGPRARLRRARHHRQRRAAPAPSTPT